MLPELFGHAPNIAKNGRLEWKLLYFPRMKAAIYIAIVLHFLRKMLRKVSVSREVPGNFPRFSPGERVCLNVTVSHADGGYEIFNGIIGFPEGTTRQRAWDILEELGTLRVDLLFGPVTSVTDIGFSVLRGEVDKGDWGAFRARYGIRAFGIINMVVKTGQAPKYAHPV